MGRTLVEGISRRDCIRETDFDVGHIERASPRWGVSSIAVQLFTGRPWPKAVVFSSRRLRVLLRFAVGGCRLWPHCDETWEQVVGGDGCTGGLAGVRLLLW